MHLLLTQYAYENDEWRNPASKFKECAENDDAIDWAMSWMESSLQQTVNTIQGPKTITRVRVVGYKLSEDLQASKVLEFYDSYVPKPHKIINPGPHPPEDYKSIWANAPQPINIWDVQLMPGPGPIEGN